MRDGHVNWLCRLVAVLVMLFLVAPLVVIVLASFTPTALVTFPPQGFSLKWYEMCIRDSPKGTPLKGYVQAIRHLEVRKISRFVSFPGPHTVASRSRI